jgi:hypothetical protein
MGHLAELGFEIGGGHVGRYSQRIESPNHQSSTENQFEIGAENVRHRLVKRNRGQCPIKAG